MAGQSLAQARECTSPTSQPSLTAVVPNCLVCHPSRPSALNHNDRRVVTRELVLRAPSHLYRSSISQLSSTTHLRLNHVRLVQEHNDVRNTHLRDSKMCSRVCGIGPSPLNKPKSPRPSAPHRDHVLHIIRVTGTVYVCVVTVRDSYSTCDVAIVIPRSRSSGALSIRQTLPPSTKYFRTYRVNAAVSVVLPWST